MALGNSNWLAVNGGWMTNDAGSKSVGNWVPEVFSKKMQAKFYASSILPQVSNSEYQGEISGQGSKVVIRTVPAISISNYTGTVSYTDPQSDKVELVIDKAKSFAFRVDDVLKAQADVDFWTAASKDAAENMRIAVEQDFLGNIAAGSSLTDITVGTVGVTPAKPTGNGLLTAILQAGRVLDENNIPETDRFVVLGPQQIELLKDSDLKLAYLTGDGQSTLRSGKVGTIDRFTVYWSNNLSKYTAGGNNGGRSCLVGHKKFACFASQFVKTETVRLETTFGDGVRGLKVYGYKVIVPTAGLEMIVAES